MLGDAILIMVVLAGQVVIQTDAMVTSWDRCSELAVQFNADDGKNDGVFIQAFCTDAGSLLIQNIYLESNP